MYKDYKVNSVKLFFVWIVIFNFFASTVLAETIIHNNIIYKTVISPYTKRVWLDRNLGAKKVCADIKDSNCFGNLYQWGRDIEGEESIGWYLLDGISICPINYRVPSSIEIQKELKSIAYKDGKKYEDYKDYSNGTYTYLEEFYSSFLQIPTSYIRNRNGSINTTSSSYLWTSDEGISANISGLYVSNLYLTYGLPVRCIKEKEIILSTTNPSLINILKSKNINSTLYGFDIATNDNLIVISDLIKNGRYSGVIDIYLLNNEKNTVSYLKTLTSPEGEEHHVFGKSLTMNNKFLIVGDFKDEVGGTNSVYVYKINNENITYLTKITVNNNDSYSQFGNKVSIYNNNLLVTSSSGVYLFNINDDGTYKELDKISNESGIHRNSSIDMNENYVIIGAESEMKVAYGSYKAGAVYIFKRNTDKTLTLLKKLSQARRESYIDGGKFTSGYQFGSSISIDKDIIVIGAPGREKFEENVLKKGKVYLYKTYSENNITQINSITSDTPNSSIGSYVNLLNNKIIIREGENK